jgi:DNA-binding response OmpR family regulator
MRILYIEDDEVLAQVVQLGLKPMGYAVDLAPTAEEGLSALASGHRQLVGLEATTLADGRL